MKHLRKAIRLLSDQVYTSDWDPKEYYSKTEEAKAFILDTIRVGAEYSDKDGTMFGVVLEEMSSPHYDYRVSWYDDRGFFGHQEVTDFNQAASELISMLGVNIKLAPGSLEYLFPMWEPAEALQARKVIASIKQAVEYDPEYARPPQYVSQGESITINVDNLLFNKWNPINEKDLEEIKELLQQNYELPPVAVTYLEISDEDEADTFSENYYRYDNFDRLEPGEYWVIEDGHHRAKAWFDLGFDEIDAVSV